MTRTSRLRQLLARPPVVSMGVYDALTARLAEAAGFGLVNVSGYGVAATLLGQPDAGFLSLADMADVARRIVAATAAIPVICDADTGYGNAVTARRAVAVLEQAGAAGLHVEDQVFPKTCGHTSGKEVIAAAEMAMKVKAMCEARADPDFLIIARTDAIAVTGLDDAIDRGRRYLDAGADALFVDAPETMAQVERVARAFEGRSLVFNAARTGKSPELPVAELGRLGYGIVMFAIEPLMASHRAIERTMRRIAADGSSAGAAGEMTAFADFNRFIGFDEVRALEQHYAAPQETP